MNGMDAEHYVEDTAVEDGTKGVYAGSPIRSEIIPGIDLLYFDTYMDALILCDVEPREDARYLRLRPFGERRVIRG